MTAISCEEYYEGEDPGDPARMKCRRCRGTNSRREFCKKRALITSRYEPAIRNTSCERASTIRLPIPIRTLPCAPRVDYILAAARLLAREYAPARRSARPGVQRSPGNVALRCLPHDPLPAARPTLCHSQRISGCRAPATAVSDGALLQQSPALLRIRAGRSRVGAHDFRARQCPGPHVAPDESVRRPGHRRDSRHISQRHRESTWICITRAETNCRPMKPTATRRW